MTWSIDPAAARTLLDKVMDRVVGIDAVAEKHSEAIDGAAAAAANAPATAAALAVVGADPLMRGVAASRRYVEDVVLTVDSVIGIYELPSFLTPRWFRDQRRTRRDLDGWGAR